MGYTPWAPGSFNNRGENDKATLYAWFFKAEKVYSGPLEKYRYKKDVVYE